MLQVVIEVARGRHCNARTQVCSESENNTVLDHSMLAVLSVGIIIIIVKARNISQDNKQQSRE